MIIQYTGLSEVTGEEPPTYCCVGTRDGIASYRVMEGRVRRIQANGTDAEIEVFQGLPHGFGGALGMAAVFCGATNCPLTSILLAYELFGGAGLELIALGCGVCYMLSGTHGLYSSQLFVTEKLLSEYTESWGKRLRK